MRYKNKRERIAKRKAIAIIKTALTVATIISLNSAIDYVRVLPEERALTFINRPLKLETHYALETKAPRPETPEDAHLPTPEPESPPELKNRALFTAYTASKDETDGNPGITASNKEVRIGIIACPRNLPFGTKVYIEGRGVHTCEDRMAKKHTERFDIYMETKAEAFAFGKRTLGYKIID